MGLARKWADRLRRRVADPVRQSLRRLSNRDRDFQPVFVAGAMGSGTTLLAVELWRCFEFAGLVTESALQVTGRSFLQTGPVDRHVSVAAYLAALEPRPDWSVAAARRDLLDLYRSRAEAPGLGVVDKGPNANLVRAGFLKRCFPDARFVLIVRDPVANVEGLRRKWPLFAREPLEVSIDFYRRIHERFLEQSAAFADEVVVVDYDGMVRRHDETLAALGERLELSRSSVPRQLDDRSSARGQGLRAVSENRVEIVQDADRAAYRSLASEDVEAIRAALGPLHRQLLGRALNR